MPASPFITRITLFSRYETPDFSEAFSDRRIFEPVKTYFSSILISVQLGKICPVRDPYEK
jgi:hypothetical protein